MTSSHYDNRITTATLEIPSRGGGGRSRCISCSDSTYAVASSFDDSSATLNLRTRHFRTPSICEQIQDEYRTGDIVYFCRSRGHGFIRSDNPKCASPCKTTQNNNHQTSESEEIFVHISDIDSDFVPRKGDKVSYKMCPIPPKFEKFQAVNVRITSMSPQPHNRWMDSTGTIEDSDQYDTMPPAMDV